MSKKWNHILNRSKWQLLSVEKIPFQSAGKHSLFDSAEFQWQQPLHYYFRNICTVEGCIHFWWEKSSESKKERETVENWSKSILKRSSQWLFNGSKTLKPLLQLWKKRVKTRLFLLLIWAVCCCMAAPLRGCRHNSPCNSHMWFGFSFYSRCSSSSNLLLLLGTSPWKHCHLILMFYLLLLTG